MTSRFFASFLLTPSRALCLAFLVLLNCGCGAKEPPLSQAVQTFKSKILKELKILTPALVPPAAKQNVEAMDKALADGFAQAEKAGEPLPFMVVVLDPHGFVLTRYPPNDVPIKQFSDYKGVKEVVKTRQIGSEVLYLADGSRIYVILAPLLADGTLVGMAGFALKADEVQEKWSVSEKEFRDINFGG